MKNLILIILFNSLLLAQSEKKSGIELPDFVITGVQSVDIPKMNKLSPEIISSLDSEVFFPEYTPEELNLQSRIIPEITVNDPTLNKNRILNFFKIGGGIYTQPLAEFSLGYQNSIYSLHLNGFGKRLAEYTDLADSETFGGTITQRIFIDNNSGFIPGSGFQLSANFLRRNFKNFASPESLVKLRQINTLNGKLEFFNFRIKNVNFYIGGESEFFQFLRYESGSTNFEELKAEFSSYLSFQSNGFKISGQGNFQLLSYNLTDFSNQELISTTGLIEYKYNSIFDIYGGASFFIFKQEENFYPKFGVNLHLSNFTISSEYTGGKSFNTYYSNSINNRYILDFGQLLPLTEREYTLASNIKYEFQRYFEINFGGSLSKINNFSYHFENININRGIISVKTFDEVEEIKLNLDFKFHHGPFGYLYGKFDFNDISYNDNQVPFIPQYSIHLTYGYLPIKNLDISFSVDYSGMFIREINSKEEYNYINLSLNSNYRFSKHFSFEMRFNNLLDQKNEIFTGYIQKPFDLLGILVLSF